LVIFFGAGCRVLVACCMVLVVGEKKQNDSINIEKLL